jgi:hypothetical protein
MWFIVSRDYNPYSSESGDDMTNSSRDEADLAVLLDFITGGRIPERLFRLAPKGEAQKTSGLQGFTGSGLSVEGEVSLDGKTTIRPSGEPLPNLSREVSPKQ